MLGLARFPSLDAATARHLAGSAVKDVPDGVLGLVAGLLDVRRCLVAMTFGFQLLIAGRFPGGFLDLPAGFLRGVFDLVSMAIANSSGRGL